MDHENEYIKAIEKLKEIEDAKVLYQLSDYFRHKANCILSFEEFLKQVKKGRY